MIKRLLFFFFSMVFVSLNAQIVIDNNPAWLIDNILPGGGITPTNHSFWEFLCR